MKWKYGILLAFTLSGRAATYYLDFDSGADANAGTSASLAWKTLEKVNGAKLQPGDHVLLKSGSVWQGQLAPTSSGAEGAPIVFDRYGKGPRPRIDGAGKVDDAIRLYNVQFIEVRGLEVTNRGEARRRGGGESTCSSITSAPAGTS